MPKAGPLPNANDLTPDASRVARFRQDLEAITGEVPGPDRRLGLAVSGGPDSMAMLVLAAAAYPPAAYPEAIRAATVDHGLRPEAAAEARAVGDACAALGVPHETLVVSGLGSGNVQDRARSARYALLRDWAVAGGLRWVAVAHQRDDVAETFLMRARRGAGLGGLAAMPRARRLGPDVQLVRPLLDWPRCELAAVTRAAGIACAADPSNTDPRFDRSRMRALIAGTPELLAQRLALAAHNLRDAEQAIEWVVAREATARLRVEEAGVWLDPDGLPGEIRRRLAHLAVTRVRHDNANPAPWREQGLDRLLASLDSGRPGTIAGVQARAIHGKWHFRMAPARRSL